MYRRGHRPASIPLAEERARRADRRRELGRRGEELAVEHLARLGLRLLSRNARTRFGEIDLIVFDGRTIVFVEVKTLRGSSANGLAGGEAGQPRPLEWLRPRQCARLRRLAHAWLSDPDIRRPRAQAIRFDAIGVVLGADGTLLSLEHLEAAW